MAEEPDPKRLEELQSRIEEARGSLQPKPRVESKYESASMAWRMVIELVVGIALGFGIGYGLDSLLGTLPIFLVLFTLLGFGAGVNVMMRTAREAQAKADKGSFETRD